MMIFFACNKEICFTVIACSDTEIDQRTMALFQTIYNSATVLGAYLLKCDLGKTAVTV